MKTKLLALSIFALGLIAAPLAATVSFAADKKGSFSSAGSRYKVSGTATVSADGTIKLSGFKTSSGPDLYVYVGNGRPSTPVAKLRRNSGSQTYKISASLAKKISTVHIHCKRFNHLFGTARVK